MLCNFTSYNICNLTYSIMKLQTCNCDSYFYNSSICGSSYKSCNFKIWSYKVVTSLKRPSVPPFPSATEHYKTRAQKQIFLPLKCDGHFDILQQKVACYQQKHLAKFLTWVKSPLYLRPTKMCTSKQNWECKHGNGHFNGART